MSAKIFKPPREQKLTFLRQGFGRGQQDQALMGAVVAWVSCLAELKHAVALHCKCA
jgi:hypothetical protein